MFIRIGNSIFNKNSIKSITTKFDRGKDRFVIKLDNGQEFWIVDDSLSVSKALELLNKE